MRIPGPSPIVFKPWIDEFLGESRAQGRSPHTIRAYGWHLYHFAIWLEEQGVTHMEEWGKEHVLEWLGDLWEIFQPATIRQASFAVRAWVRWLAQKGLKSNFAHDIPSPKAPMSPQRTLSLAEIRRLFQVCDPNAPRGARDLGLMAVLLETGLRASETVALRIQDWDKAKSTLFVRGKGGRHEFVRCTPDCTFYLDNWLNFRSRIAQPHVDALFVAIGGRTPGHPLTTRGLRLILKKLGDKAGVPGVHPHAFRRSFAVQLLKAGISTRVLQILGRWRDLRMVERYSQALLVEEAWEAVQHKTPLSQVRASS